MLAVRFISFLWVVFAVAVLCVRLTSSSSNGGIPKAPVSICIKGAYDSDLNTYYTFKSRTSKDYFRNGEDSDYQMELIDSTWIVYHRNFTTPTSSTDSNVEIYCSSMPTDYSPTTTNIGDPSDCVEWVDKSYLYSLLYDVKVTGDGADCVAFDTELSYLDWIIVGYAVSVLLYLSCHMCPFTPCHYKCKESTYDGATLETYQTILTKQGIDPSQKRKDNDNRTIDVTFLRYDLLQHKRVWQNDFSLDWLLYLRMEHPFLSLCYGHKLHPFNFKERLFTFVGVQFLAFGLAALSTDIIARSNIGDPITAFIVGFWIDYLYGMILTVAIAAFRKCAICEDADTKTASKRKAMKCRGHWYMLALFILCLYCGTYYVYDALSTLRRDFPSIPIRSVMIVFVINYLTGSMLAWYFFDLIFSRLEFEKEWHKQKGIPSPLSDNAETGCCNCSRICNTCCCCCLQCCCKPCCKLEDFSTTCMVSWMFLVCCVYYWFCKPKNKPYPTDSDNNVIGSQAGEFAIKWQDYVNYKQNVPLRWRNYDRISQKMRIIVPVMDQSKTVRSASDLKLENNASNSRSVGSVGTQSHNSRSSSGAAVIIGPVSPAQVTPTSQVVIIPALTTPNVAGTQMVYVNQQGVPLEVKPIQMLPQTAASQQSPVQGASGQQQVVLTTQVQTVDRMQMEMQAQQVQMPFPAKK